MQDITPQQSRAARALIGWKQIELAHRADLAPMTVLNFEQGVGEPKTSTIKALAETFEKAGVVFIDAGDELGEGVRLKRPSRAS